MKRPATWRVHEGLLDRLALQARTSHRTPTSIVEQALAEYLSVPLASRDLPAQPVELCPHCHRGLITDTGRCLQCRWHRDPRRSHKPVRARVQPDPKQPEAEAT